MAASDQTYRNQKTLHLVFAWSSVIMLVTTAWMFWDDYNRPFKKEQRVFRDVEEELAKRAMLAAAPTKEQRDAVVAAEQELALTREARKAVRDQADAKVKSLLPAQAKRETLRANRKADFDSVTSFYNIAVEQHGADSPEARRYLAEMDKARQQLDQLQREVEEGQATIDQVQYEKFPVPGEESQLTPKEAEDHLSVAEDKHKKLTDEFDRFVKLAAQKEWTIWDTLRGLPILEGFASPTKIQQYTLDELPIDYAFKYVTRYDRCTTCHLGLEKATYTYAALAKLSQDPASDEELKTALANAQETVAERNRVIEAYNKTVSAKDRKDKLPLSVKDLQPNRVDLDQSRVNMFAAHPRLDLYVDSNSPHPAEKFGCTACHSGQGSATTFVDATHSPNDTVTMDKWRKEHGWESIHFWDFPMYPKRFAEAACVKCHYQITDLIQDGSQVEAPTLVKGYNLVRELGCFGCHEISGMNKGRWVGPDLRLEPDPPLDSLPPAEKAKRLSDPANPPGTMRKVGPSLERISEKTDIDWVRQWIKAPRSFRPDTRMPHYYGQPNNTPEELRKEAEESKRSSQEKFPDAEIASIAHYLFTKSTDLVKQIGEHANDAEDVRQADEKAVEELTAKINDAAVPEKDKKEATRLLAETKTRIKARTMPRPVDAVQLPAAPADDKAKAEQQERGRNLFATKGCMACHQHGAMAEDGKTEGKLPLPALHNDTNFGPNLSRIISKLGTKPDDPQSARKWLINWLLSPTSHNPRTLMPYTQITEADADDIASWLLAQKSDFPRVHVEEPDLATLKALAQVWLEKSLTRRQIKTVLEEEQGFSEADLASRPADADERILGGSLAGQEGVHKLKMFIGKKAINNLGCYGCHTIPGFETTKPIGTALNEWGKKDPERIAFEDSPAYVKDNFHIVDVRRDLTPEEQKANERRPEEQKLQGWEFKDGKRPYERYFAEQLDHRHHTREGFLHLKLTEPRSYDYNRVRSWDDRIRMPQFKFARPQRQPNESDEAFALRASKEEAEGREAVMTFILGLVAEPVPAKYVYNPPQDRHDEVKGRQVLEKFNCGGCHLIRPGVYDFKLTGDKVGDKTVKDVVLGKLEEWYNALGKDPSDFPYKEHNAWGGETPKRKDLVRAHGVTPPQGKFVNDDADKFGPDEKNLFLRLTHALRFINAVGETHDIPAGTDILMPREGVGPMSDPYGGAFSINLSQYLQKRDAETYGGGKVNYSYAAGPPSLIREGEKVQPSWLFQFLRNPISIRPMTVLRMPKFNMSDEDAMAIVNYFTAVDKMINPGIGLTYPYLRVPEKDEGFLLQKTREYVEWLRKAGRYDATVKELQPVWALVSRDLIAAAESRQKAAATALDDAKKKNEGVDAAQKVAADADAEVKKLKQALDAGDFKDLQKQWETNEAYIADAYRLVANGNLCQSCHSIGSIDAKQATGPPLGLAHERLRPDWTAKWFANPQRFLHYTTVMPANFKADAKQYETEFLGGGNERHFSEDQIKAARDLLMAYPQVIDWPILKYRPGPGVAGGK
jgi:mono/diheme cytochrome c family protein